MKLAFASLETLPVAKGGDKEDHLQRLLPTSLFLLPPAMSTSSSLPSSHDQNI